MFKSLTFLVVLIIFQFTKIYAQKRISYQKHVKITRDIYGVPHIDGQRDADAVFGLMYAQCEDDYERITRNYLEKLGRLSEVEGDSRLTQDLMARMLLDQKEAKKDYKNAPKYLKELLNAHASALNFYLKKHPEKKDLGIKKYHAWMPLLWTDGSIGAISTADIQMQDVSFFYRINNSISSSFSSVSEEKSMVETGSNGFAIAPIHSSSNHALLYINPHTTFYFRPEVHIRSKEGLNAYGAVTWGQFFVYQGFNPYCGWMHTSSNADVADTYSETVKKEKNKYYYKYEDKWLSVKQKKITLRYKVGTTLQSKKITTLSTHHGPILAASKESNDTDLKYISLQHFNRSMKSLEQSWLRTKSTGFDDFKKVMEFKANTSNNTVFADYKGNIAYWHGNYMPQRDTTFNWAKAVPGDNKNTDYKGIHEVDETVHVYNPASGWIQNCNSTPFTSAGESSPVVSQYPKYMAPDGENFRGLNAQRLLSKIDKIDLEQLIALGYDRKLMAFEILLPLYLEKTKLYSAAIDTLKNWNYVSDSASVATTLAILWMEKLGADVRRVYTDQGQMDQVRASQMFIQSQSASFLDQKLEDVLSDLKEHFGTWQVQWGKFNRYQRLAIPDQHNDHAPSLPSSFASGLWGSLPSFTSKTYPDTRLRYGYSGNSFVCAIEFGSKIKAYSLLAGGNSSDPHSKHFDGEAKNFLKGKFKEVLFYPEDIQKNVIRTYRPGE